MNVPEILPSELHLESLTELERDAIFEVLKRDMELQRKESEKIRILRTEVNQLQLLSTETETSGNQDKVCPMCRVEFGWLFHRGDLCPRCQTKVCDKCRQTGTSKHKWLCTLCSKQIELKTRWGSWFYPKFRRSRRRIRDNGIPTKREDTPDPFARKKAPSSDEIVPFADPSSDSKIEAKKDFVVFKEQESSLSKTHFPLENVIFPKESDKKLLAELLAMKKYSSLSSPTEDIISSEENSPLSSKQTMLNDERVKSGGKRIEISHAMDSNASNTRSGSSVMLECSGFKGVQQKSQNFRSSSDCLRQSRDCWDMEADSSTSTDEELAVKFQPKSKTVNGQVHQSAERLVAEVSEHLDKMPVAQSHGVGSPSSPQETQAQSIWFSPSLKSTAAAVHMVKSDGRDMSLADGRMKLETVVSTSDTIPEHFRQASVTKCSHKPDVNLTQNEMHRAKDEIDSRGLLKFTNTKTHLHETDRKLGLNVNSKPESVANRFVVYDEDDDDDSLSVISEKTEKEVDLDLQTNIVNSSDLFNSDPEDEEWCRNMRNSLLLKEECLVSVSDQQELDSFISHLASEEIMLTMGRKVNPSFDSVTENNKKVLQLPSVQENVKFKAEKKNAERQPSMENEVFNGLEKNDLNYVVSNLELFDNKQVNTSCVESSPRTVSFKSKADTQDHPLPAVKTSFLLKEINDLASRSQEVVKENMQVTGAIHLTSCECLSKKQDGLNFLQKYDSDSDFFKDSKSLRTQQKHHQSRVRSDSLSHLVSDEFAHTGTSSDLEGEISASAAYNEVFLSELDRNLSLSEICEKQSWNDQNVVDKEHSKTCSKSTMIANLHEKIDLQLVKKQLGIGAKVSSETISSKYHNTAVQKKIVLQEVLKSNEDQKENGNKMGKIKLFSSSDQVKYEEDPTEGFHQGDYESSFYGIGNHVVRDPVRLESLACGNSLETASLNESMDLTDFGHGSSLLLVSNIFTSKETDSEAEAWNVVERSALLPSVTCTNSEEYQTITFADGEMLHQVNRGVAGGLKKKTIPTEQLLSQNQEDSQFSDEHLKHASVSSLADKQVRSSQFCRSEAEEKFSVQESLGSVANDQQLLLQPAQKRAALTSENDDTDDDMDLQSSGSMMLNEGAIFVGHKVPERVSPQLNIAAERTIAFEMLSADDWLQDAEDEMATAKYSNVAGAFLSATSHSVQFCLARVSVPLPDANIRAQLDTEAAFQGEPYSSQKKVSPVLIITQHEEDNDHECAEVVNGDLAAATSNSVKVVQDNLSSKQSFSSIKATSQESIISYYSNPGKSHLGKIAVTGEIELSIRYNGRSSTIDVFVRQCRGLAAADAKKKRSDPYVKTYLLPNKSKPGKRKTAIKKNTLNPVYNEVLRYEVDEEQLERHTLWVSVWHNDRFGRNEFLGDVLIQLDNRALSEIEPQWYNLEQEAGVKWKSVLSLTSKADLDVSLKYVTADRTVSKIKGKQKKPYGELLATVKMARNLSAIHGNNLSNPFCKCRLLPEQLHQSKQKTRIVKHSCNPTWNHTFVFTSIALEDLEDCGLELTIWDHDRLKSHDFLGGVRLNLGSPAIRQPGKEWMDAAGDEISLWRNMVIHPNEWVEATVPLRLYMGD